MLCPHCTDETLEPHHRAGIELDVCPRCRGVWLDRGELARLAADSEPADVGDPAGSVPPAPWSARHDDHLDDHRPVGPQRRADSQDRGAGRADRDERRANREDRVRRPERRRRKSRTKRLGDAIEDLFEDVLDL
jgi:Zn-finger nucleic acid-binding protein